MALATERPLWLRVGLASWSFVGAVAAGTIVVAGLTAVGSVVLPMVFAAVLAVLFRPVAARLERRRVPPTLAAGAVVLGLVCVAIAVVALTVRGIVDQAATIGDDVEAALAEVEVDDETIAQVRDSLEEMKPALTSGVVSIVRSGLSGVSAFAIGALLGALIMYYLLKDGPALRRQLVRSMPPGRDGEVDRFIADSCLVLRRYWLGRTIVSGVVAAVIGLAAVVLGLPTILTLVLVSFIGGYVPYIGAVASGGLAVVVALGDEGVTAAVVMLVVVLAANLLIENLVDPAITGRTLKIHPLVVLLVTTIGGIVGGLVGLVLAVPLFAIVTRAAGRVRELVDLDTDAVRDTLRRTIDRPTPG